MEHPSSSLVRPRDVAAVSLFALLLPARPALTGDGAPVDPPEAPADRGFSPAVVNTSAQGFSTSVSSRPPLVLPPRPGINPFVALADLWERQAAKLEDLSASVGGDQGVNAAAALLRENAAELRETLAMEGGR